MGKKAAKKHKNLGFDPYDDVDDEFDDDFEEDFDEDFNEDFEEEFEDEWDKMTPEWSETQGASRDVERG